MKNYFSAGVALACLMLGSPAAAQLPISPRLLDTVSKSPFGVSALLIPADGKQLPAIAGSEILPDGSVLAQLPIAQIETIAASGALGWAMPQQSILLPDDFPAPPMRSDAQTIAKSAPGRQGHGNGSGVRIGVIDFAAVSAGNPVLGQLRGTWPAGGLAPAGSNTHTDQVLAIINELAPAAELLLFRLPANPVDQDVRRAAKRLAEEGAQIINFSGASYGDRRDGRAPLDQLADELSARGILFVTVSGNDAQRSWQAPLLDTDRDGMVDVAGGGILLKAKGGKITLQLSWDDWGLARRRIPTGFWDIDLELFDAAGKLVKAQNTRRGLVGEPIETLDVGALAPGDYIVRLPYRTTALRIGRPIVQLVATGAVDSLVPSVAKGSIAIPGTARGALTVGASDGQRPAAYSGRGPTLDGRTKPDLLANPVGLSGRAGTSYAAPRIAGLAAQLLSKQPQLDLMTLRATLIQLGSQVP